MTKNFLRLMTLAIMTASLITGCGSEEEAAVTTAAPATTEAVTTAEAVTEAPAETSTEEVTDSAEELTEYNITFDAFSLGGVEVTFDDETGGTDVEQMMSIGCSSYPGKTLKESMKEFGILDIDVVTDGETFEGWMEYKDIMAMHEDGFEYLTSYEKVSDNLYTTEEILSIVLDQHTTFVAKWESISYEEYALYYEYTEEGLDLDLDVTVYSNGGLMNYGDHTSDLAVATIESGFSLETFLGDSAEIKSVEKEGYTFNGWCVYASEEIIYTAGLDEAVEAGSFCVSLEEYGYAAMNDFIVVNEFATTEELYDIICDGKSYLAVANWAEGEKEILKCSGCEIEKACGKYEVNGQTYVVCDDCYNEFATGMGLKND
ncbi:MAG: hypothetical protein E7246_07345 [Lachnoclostridium sp.]|nr:hypothetical protein [Lachnoclostridium sp.]